MTSTKFVYFGPIGKTRWPSWSLIGWYIFDFSSEPLNGIQRNLTGSKISISSTKFVFFGLIGKTRWPPWHVIDWDIIDFSSETAERNSTKLDRKQYLNVLNQVCVFRADQTNKMAILSDLSIKVAHCTQVHDIWPFGPVVYIKSISVHLLLRMNVVLDFICMVFAELQATKRKRKNQNENMCLRRPWFQYTSHQNQYRSPTDPNTKSTTIISALFNK